MGLVSHASPPPLTMNKPALKIGLSLSGGGARGAAHIGVLQALLEHDIQPYALAGASAGAIIGSLHAAGKTPQDMLDFIQESKMLKLMSFGFKSGGLSHLTYLRDRLAEVLPEDSFESLGKPVYIAISNLNTGLLEIRHSGPLFDVVMASSSIPLVFKPVEINGQQYVDGGLLCNLPVKPLVRDCDFVIGVNVMPHIHVPDKSVQSVIGIAARCFDLSIQANTQPNAALCDLLIEPKEVSQYHIFQFTQYQRIYEIGYEETIRRMPLIKDWIRLKEYSIGLGNYSAPSQDS